MRRFWQRSIAVMCLLAVVLGLSPGAWAQSGGDVILYNGTVPAGTQATSILNVDTTNNVVNVTGAGTTNVLSVQRQSTATNAVRPASVFRHQLTSGTISSGFGVSNRYQAMDPSNNVTDIGRLQFSYHGNTSNSTVSLQTLQNGTLTDLGGFPTGVFNLVWYGVYGDGSHDDTAAIQAAINDAQAVGGTVYCPQGAYAISSALSITGPMKFKGPGGMSPWLNSLSTGGGCRILASSQSQNVFSVAANSASNSPYDPTAIVEFEDFSIDVVYSGGSPILKTAGAGILVNGASSSQCGVVNINRVMIRGMYNGIDSGSGGMCASTITNSRITKFINYGLRLASPAVPDGGNILISNNYIVGVDNVQGGATSATGVRWESGGGLHFANNTVGATGSYDLDIEFQTNTGCGAFGSCGTQDMVITGNTFEAAATALRLATAGTATLAHIMVTGNEFSNVTTSVVTSAANPNTLFDIAVTGNYMTSTGSGSCMDLDGVGRMSVTGNVCVPSASGFGFVTRLGASAVRFGENVLDLPNGTTPFSLAGAASIVGWYGLTSAQLPTAVNGSYMYCSNCKGPQDTSWSATAVCSTTAPATGAIARRLNGSWYCN